MPTFAQWTDAYKLTSAGAAPLWIVPVVWGYKGDPPVAKGCGLYFIEPGKTTAFLPTVGADPEPLVKISARAKCSRMRAIGLAHDPGDHPRIIVSYSGHYGTSRIYFYEILRWNDGSSRYEISPDTPTHTVGRFSDASIPENRARLALER